MADHERDPGSPARDERAEERADRNLAELLQELRVLQTGVQIIFAFLLGIAFTARFTQLSQTQQYVYVAALLMSVVSVAVLAAPVAIHRGVFRSGMKERVVTLSTHCARVGTLFLSIALDCAVFLIIDVVLGRVAASIITGCVAATFLALWFVFPWALRRS
ncbi:ABC-type multidrug transport system permease subunit [Catenulispora sp. GP43]|uniref:DUF6328 family protein n=1 Tax=Catenulispora sp. GP43 TaxID=3156263 RepID=UPI00351109D5